MKTLTPPPPITTIKLSRAFLENVLPHFRTAQRNAIQPMATNIQMMA